MKKHILAILLALCVPAFAADITITIPDAAFPRVRDAICLTYGYQATLGLDAQGQPIPNPETKVAFAKRMMIRWMKEQVKTAEGLAAQKAAQTSTDAAVDAIAIQ